MTGLPQSFNVWGRFFSRSSYKCSHLFHQAESHSIVEDGPCGLMECIDVKESISVRGLDSKWMVVVFLFFFFLRGNGTWLDGLSVQTFFFSISIVWFSKERAGNAGGVSICGCNQSCRPDAERWTTEIATESGGHRCSSSWDGRRWRCTSITDDCGFTRQVAGRSIRPTVGGKEASCVFIEAIMANSYVRWGAANFWSRRERPDDRAGWCRRWLRSPPGWLLPCISLAYLKNIQNKQKR